MGLDPMRLGKNLKMCLLREAGGRNLKQTSCLQVEEGWGSTSIAGFLHSNTFSTRPKNRYNFWCATLIRVIHKALQGDAQPNKGFAVTLQYFPYRPLNGLRSQKVVASVSQRLAVFFFPSKVNFFFPFPGWLSLAF